MEKFGLPKMCLTVVIATGYRYMVSARHPKFFPLTHFSEPYVKKMRFFFLFPNMDPLSSFPLPPLPLAGSLPNVERIRLLSFTN